MSKPVEACDCTQGDKKIQNTGGHLSCGKGIKKFKHAVGGNQLKVDGTSNGIKVGIDTVDTAYWTGRFTDPIRADRLWPIDGILSDFDSPIVDDNTEDATDGRVFFLNKNTKEVTTSIYTDEPYVLAAKIEANACHLDSMFLFDTADSLIGQLKSSTDFAMLKIQKDSFRVGIINATDTTKSRVQLIWKWDDSTIEVETDYFTVAAMDGFRYSRDVTANIDANIVDLFVDDAGATFRIEGDFGGAVEGLRIGLGGLNDLNLEAYNVTDSAVIVNSGIVGGTNNGDYIATWDSALTVGKTVRIQPITQDIHLGYDLGNIADTTVVSV